jgi:hypothetical protein
MINIRYELKKKNVELVKIVWRNKYRIQKKFSLLSKLLNTSFELIQS